MSACGMVVRAHRPGETPTASGRQIPGERPCTVGDVRPRPALLVRLWALVLAVLAGLALAGPATATAADPVLELHDGTPSQLLYGGDVPVELTASLPAGSAKGYNLAYRVVLPDGARYVAGSAGTQGGDPRQIVDPASGRTTLIWANVDDLVADSSHTLAFRVRYATTDDAPATHFDVGDQLAIESGAFISANARDEADFSAGGEPVGPRSGSFSARADSSRDVALSAIEIEKAEPHPEGEIPRGVHNHQTVYTLKVRNNSVNPSTGIMVEDFVPAGLEFLGCAAQADNTTNTTTNPGSAEEYPGSGPIVVTAPTTADGCTAPDRVETVQLDPDGSGPLPFGVYTHVRWNLDASLLEGGTTTLRYAAAIPLRENTLDWTGATPGPTGQQTANLDNNSGPETYDEQLLRNGARASGVYRAPGKPGRDTEDWDVLDRTAEDIAIQKRGDKGSLEQGDLTKWTIDLQVSEYRSLDDVVITDTVPDGLCPLGPANYERTGAGLPAATAECDPVPGKSPSEPFTDVTEQADGSFVVTWDETTFPDLAHLKPSETRRLTFWTRTRESYQQDFDDATPVLSMDAVTNELRVQGVDWVRCSSAPSDCTSSGTKIWHQEADGELDFDDSSSGKAATGPQLVKQVAAVFPGDGQCSNLAAAQYGKTVPVYGPGDQVCWKLRIEFPEHLDTRSQDVFDLLPSGLEYVAGSSQPTAANTVGIAEVDGSVPGRIRWAIGDDDLIDRGGQVFEVTFQSTVGSVDGHASGDVEGNLLKFSYENTAGTAFTLRDRTDFALKLPQLSLLKGVRRVNGEGTVAPPAPNGPNVDHVRVHEGDEVEYRVDVSNAGAAPIEQGHVWDVLPVGITCAQVDLTSISDGGSCNAFSNRIEWTTVALAAGTPDAPATKTLTYELTIPDGVSPDTTFVNTAGVTRATYVANDGTPYVVVPDNPVVKDPALTPNAPKAEDPSDVYTPKAAVTKTRTTSVGESGNAASSQATIGETVRYTVTTTIPAGTTIYGTPTVVDALGTRQRYVEGTLSGTLDGVDLPTAGISAAVASNTVTATFPSTFKTGTQDAVLVLTFDVTVLDVDANVRGATLPNKATLTYQTPTGATKTLDGSTSTKIVEPKVATSKTHAPAHPERIRPGQIVDFTVTARNATGSNVSTAHDAVVVDTLPAGTDPVDANGDFLADGATVPGHGGVWDAAARTITWTTATTPALASLAPGASTDLQYRVRLENPATVGMTYRNTVDLNVRSLDGTVPGTRTSGSTSTTATDYDAVADDTIAVVLPAITKTVTPGTGTIGTPVTWTVKVTLPKDVRYFDTTVVDTVPDGFDVDRYGAMSCTSGCVGDEPAPSSFPVTDAGSGKLQAAWYLGDLQPTSNERVYTLVVEGHIRDTYRNAPGGKVLDGTSLTNRASVKTNRSDKVPGTPGSVPGTFDDTVGPATATVQVKEPKLTLTKTADRSGWVEGGDRVTYTVKLKNTGNWPAYDVVVRDEPDVELTDVQLGSGVSTSLNTDMWSADDRTLEWKIPGPVAVGETVTFTYTADVKAARDLTAGDVIENVADIDEYWGLKKLDRDTHPWDYRRYTGPSSRVELTVVKPNLTIAKTPDAGDAAAKVVAGGPATFTIKVKNTDGRATARNVVVRDELPTGLSYAAGSATAVPSSGFSETNVNGQTITWRIASLGPNQTVTITLPVTVASSVPNGTTLTNLAATHADEVPEEKTDTGDLEVEAKADLQVTKTASPSPVIPGQNVTFTLKTKNDGPSDAHDSTLVDTLPPYLTLVSLSDTDACVADGQKVTCEYGTLTPGAERELVVVAKVDPARTQPVVNAATVTTTTPDPKPENDEDDVTVQVDPKADVSIVKSVDGGVVQGGDTVTYTLSAHNHGPSTATTVKIADAVPSDLTIVSATLVGPPAVPCTVTGQQVDCAVGALAPGADATVQVVTTAKGAPPAPKGSELQHLIDVDKQERNRQLAPGERWSVDVTCPAGGIATDGSVRIQDINDQSWSQIDGVEIEQARAIALSTYRFVIRNATDKGVHIKPFVTCLDRQTTGSDHVHPLDVGDLTFQTTGVLAAGQRQTLFFPGDRSHRAVAPGIETLDGVARLVASEPATVGGVEGWKLTVEAVSDGTRATVSLRSLSAYVTPAGDPLHTHRMSFEHVASTVTLQPGEVKKQIRVGSGGNSCPVDHEGIVGSYDLPNGVVSLGNEPQPVNRDFDLYNTTDQVQTVTIDVECVSLRLESPVTVVEVENTASVTSITPDPVPTNNSSSATIGIERAVLPDDVDPGPGDSGGPGAGGGGTDGGAGGGDGGAGGGLPVVPPAPGGGTAGPSLVPPAPGGGTAPVALRFGTVTVTRTGTSASVPVTCRSASRCRGTVTVTARVRTSSARGVAAERARKARTRTVVIGRARYDVKRGKTAKVRVKITKKYRSLLKAGKVRNVSLRTGKVKATKKVVVQKKAKAKKGKAKKGKAGARK